MWNTTGEGGGGGSDVSTVSPGVAGMVTVLASLGVVLVVVLTAFQIRFRHERMIKMSSPNLNLATLAAAAILYVCSVLFGADGLGGKLGSSQLTVVCQIRTWLLSLSVTVFYGTILTKAWRVRRIFSNKKLKALRIPDVQLFGIVVGMTSVDVVILVIWQIVDPLSHTSTFLYDQTGAMTASVFVCSSRYSEVWVSCAVLYKVALLLYGTYLAWSIRQVSLVPLNDGHAIVISTYMTVLLSCGAFSLHSLLLPWPSAVLAVTAGGIWLPTTATLCLMFIPKIRMWRQGWDLEKLRLSHHAVPPAEAPVSADDSSCRTEGLVTEVEELVNENERLRIALAKKDGLIDLLESRLKEHPQLQRNCSFHAQNNSPQLSEGQTYNNQTLPNLQAKRSYHVQSPKDSGLDLNESTLSSLEEAKRREGQIDLLHAQARMSARSQKSDTAAQITKRRKPSSNRSVVSELSSRRMATLREFLGAGVNTSGSSGMRQHVSLSQDQLHVRRLPVRICPSPDLLGSVQSTYGLPADGETMQFLRTALSFHWNGCAAIPNDTFYPPFASHNPTMGSSVVSCHAHLEESRDSGSSVV